MNFNDFIRDPKADLSVATLAMVEDNLCFVFQPRSRWGKNELGQITLPFGGIGGKVEPAEDLLSALSRSVGKKSDVIVKLSQTPKQLFRLSITITLLLRKLMILPILYRNLFLKISNPNPIEKIILMFLFIVQI